MALTKIISTILLTGASMAYAQDIAYNKKPIYLEYKERVSDYTKNKLAQINTYFLRRPLITLEAKVETDDLVMRAPKLYTRQELREMRKESRYQVRKERQMKRKKENEARDVFWFYTKGLLTRHN